MYILKKILGIDRHRSCFCGRPLVNNFCDIHGMDIKISTYIIHGQFEYFEEKNDPKGPINVTLTENQFINLFSQKDLGKLYLNDEEYMIKISQIDSNKDLQTIIDYFFNQIESDVFFGYHRFKESQITDSNIMLNFLYNYEIKNSQSMIIKFNILVVRNLIDYIKWRLNHFKALPENIIKSLMSVRKKIYSSEGELGNIVNVEWNLEEKLPKKVIVQNQKTNKIDEFSPANLFQGKENLQLNTKQENRIYSALRNFSQHFLKSLKNYFVSQSCIAIIEKINQSKIAFYENLIGKNIKNTIDLHEHFQNQIA